MTWQNSYIQPGNERLLGLTDGIISVIYGSNPTVSAGFDFFDGMGSADMAICDIDGCFTNNIQLPTLPQEHMYIRALNALKNSKIANYDKAYPLYQSKEELKKQLPGISNPTPEQLAAAATEEFVTQVREAFFAMLRPFLYKIENYINKRIQSNDAYFDIYFLKNEYLSHF